MHSLSRGGRRSALEDDQRVEMQEQLFSDFGRVKVFREAWRLRDRRVHNARRKERSTRLIARLEGDGSLRRDPLTGNMYEVYGTSVTRAYEVPCSYCGKALYRVRKQLKLAGGKAWCFGHSSVAEDGTKSQAGGGYIKVKRAGVWVLEHIAVMEEELGRALLDTETVHHINGVRDDNRPQNLQLRQGHHGSGQVLRCADCGSNAIVALPLEGGVPQASVELSARDPFPRSLAVSTGSQGPPPKPQTRTSS